MKQITSAKNPIVYLRTDVSITACYRNRQLTTMQHDTHLLSARCFALSVRCRWNATFRSSPEGAALFKILAVGWLRQVT